MHASAFVSTSLLAVLLAWTLYRYLDASGDGPGTFDGKCFGMLLWAVVVATTVVLCALTWTGS